ncbi:MAG: FAD-binding protein [Coriobacteriales bacterium]|jgi:fumarate reductase flavoprotein subunit|nr:FAD-binding protein [Coriobacteriales bacterium]
MGSTEQHDDKGTAVEERGEAEAAARGLSRRSFIKGASFVALGAGTGLALAACSPAASEEPGAASDAGPAPNPEASMAAPATERSSIWDIGEIGEPTQSIEAEVCIVGGGGTGMAAAVQCVELGLKPVVIEALGGYGGSFIGTEFITAVGSEQQKATGASDSVKDAVTDHLTYHHWIPRRKLTEAFIGQMADTAEWLEDHGIGFAFTAGYRNRALAYDDGGEAMRGLNFVNILGGEAERLGVEAHFNMRARRLLVEDGAVKGVLAEDADGRIVEFRSSVVILGTGGYANNEEFRKEVAAWDIGNAQALGMNCRNADGIKMAADAGAAMAESLGTVMWCGPVIVGAISASWQTGAYVAGVQPTLWLNQDGERYLREDLFQENFSGTGVCVRNQKRTFVLFTEEDLLNWETSGSYAFPFSFGLPGTPLPDIRPTLEPLDSVHVNESIEAAATEADLDPAAVKATLDRYNALCDAAEGLDGEDTSADEDFGKKAQYLRPMREGPYWLCEVADGFYTTVGGIKINERTEVTGTDDEVIPGLYAGGCDAGGIHGDSYDVMYLGGSGASWAINSGRLAAKSAATFLGK